MAVTPDKRVDLIVEIASCRNLLIADIRSSDPYVKAKVGEEDIHKTKVIMKNLNPAYTPQLDSLFYVAKDKLENDGLFLKVKDYDMGRINDELGSVLIPSQDIFNCIGKSTELKLDPPRKKKNKDAGFITICCHPADSYIADFVEHLKLGKKSSEFPLVKNHASLAKLLVSYDPTEENDIEVLIEILSCTNLLIGDVKSSDPFVKARYAGHEIHRTKHIWKTLNPVFHRKTDSVFYFSDSKSRLNRKGGLFLEVMDYDVTSSDDLLGSVQIPPPVLEEASGESIHFKLDPPRNKKGDAGSIIIRCHNVDRHDKKLVQHLKEGKKSSDYLGIESYKRLGVTTRGEFSCELRKSGGAQKEFLIEVVSCWDLLGESERSPDPYVKVRFKGQFIHETKHIKKTRNPVFTVKSDALFIYSVSAMDLHDYSGFLFNVMDYDWVTKDDYLGSVRVPAETILDATGERLEFELDPPDGSEEADAGKIAIRIRHATDHDKTLLSGIKNKERLVKGMEPSTMENKKMFKHFTKIEKSGKEKGMKKYLVRPGPDPENKSGTTWMSNERIQEEAWKESKKWTDIGTGTLGKVFVEIIGADDLQNRDDSLLKSNKTDAFVSLIFEDCMAVTDVIDDCLSPRWLPWMQRAFLFRMMHSSSQLLIGVFDNDSKQHGFVGRVSVDITNLRKDTMYTLQYNIYESTNLSERKPLGTITLRIRIEIEDMKKVVLSNLKPPPAIYVNVREKNEFTVMKRTCTGKNDPGVYSKETIYAYVDELTTYGNLLFYINDAVTSVLFWRGTFPLKITKKFTIFLPINSAGIFISGVTLVERPRLIPSFFFFSIAWALLAVMRYRKSSPNVWDRCKTFEDLLGCLLIGRSLNSPLKITKHENEQAAEEFDEKWRKRIEEAEKLGEENRKKRLKEREEYEKQMEEIGETEISTETNHAISFDPLKAILYPVQGYLGITLDWIRFIKNIVIWEECYFSFLTVMACLILGSISLIVPWPFVIRWTIRLITWCLLGPWMKLVDIYWCRKVSELTQDEKKEREEIKIEKIQLASQAAIDDARLRREEALKLKDWKAALFGAYITRIPTLKMDRYRDRPLHTSEATPFKKVHSNVEFKCERIYGQHLEGTMVPKFTSRD